MDRSQSERSTRAMTSDSAWPPPPSFGPYKRLRGPSVVCVFHVVSPVLDSTHVSPRRPVSCSSAPPTRRRTASCLSTPPTWSCLLLHPRPLDSSLLHSSSSCSEHDLHTSGCGQKNAAIVGCRTMEHPSPRNTQPWPQDHDPQNREARQQRFAHFTELAIISVQEIVDFAKQVPGFLQLNREDQIALLKASTIEIMLLETSRRYNMQAKSICFLKDFSYNKDDFARAGKKKDIPSLLIHSLFKTVTLFFFISVFVSVPNSAHSRRIIRNIFKTFP
uniref:NR LBD domain-containing protein n=1 Tax=Eptatretus burgeri TaxID=7764 RepID=A0A8C4Q290_EPTBU